MGGTLEDFLLFLALLGLGISSGYNAMSRDRTTAIIGGLTLAIWSFILFSTPASGSFVQFVRNETGANVGYLGIIFILGGIALINWRNNIVIDLIGCVVIVAGAMLFTVSGFGDPFINGFHDLQLAPPKPEIMPIE